MDELEFNRGSEEIRQSLLSFNNQAGSHRERGCSLVRQTTYWVYDARQRAFGPNKFVAYRNMTFDRYENALHGNFYGAPFDGHAARLAIEGILGSYEVDDLLTSQLVRWAESLFFVGVLDGIRGDKWRFVSLP